jgi:hypothetical protein
MAAKLAFLRSIGLWRPSLAHCGTSRRVPIPFAPLLGFLIGLGFAWAARAAIGKDEGPLLASRHVAIAAAFAALVYAPMAAYFLVFHGDWAYLYLMDWRHVPSAVDLVLVIVAGGSVPAGTIAASAAARARRLKSVVRLGAIPAALVLALLALGGHRLALSATYTQYHGDFGTESIASSALGRGVLWMAIVGALGIAWSLRAIGQGGASESRGESPLTSP